MDFVGFLGTEKRHSLSRLACGIVDFSRHAASPLPGLDGPVKAMALGGFHPFPLAA